MDITGKGMRKDMDNMDRREGEQMARLACKALSEKKAVDIKVIDIHEVSVLADYFIISTASNPNQVQAMVDLSLIHI